MYQSLVEFIDKLIYVPGQGMVHPGLSEHWVLVTLFVMLVIVIRSVLVTNSIKQMGMVHTSTGLLSLCRLPMVGQFFSQLVIKPWVLLGFKVLASALFLLVVYAGLFGTPVPERNIATMLTWTVWWSAVVISVFFVGSAWCAVCPWDAIATWLVRRKLWRRGAESTSLNLRVPRILRSIWPALFMFIGLTWLELGAGVTTSPYATALLALLMVVLATISLAVYERKAFCRYFCPVGRTLGAYGAMAPIALRPVDNQVCADCKTLECYHGTKDIEPCPTHLVMGRISQNTYCTSCGACSQSCPHQNVGWRLRGIGEEITYASRPHTDEAWFILGLMALTIFHGFTMMPYWENWMRQLAYTIGDSGQILVSFTIGMIISIMIPVLLYLLVITITRWLGKIQHDVQRLFNALAFSLLPLAFTYHIAHNLSHLVRESQGFWSVLFNPLGTDTLPLTMHELHMRHMQPLLDNEIVYALQATLVLFGFWLSLRIAGQRLLSVIPPQQSRLGTLKSYLPIQLFITIISLINLWLLMQPMIMRM
jgi:polyferredoxin